VAEKESEGGGEGRMPLDGAQACSRCSVCFDAARPRLRSTVARSPISICERSKAGSISGRARMCAGAGSTHSVVQLRVSGLELLQHLLLALDKDGSGKEDRHTLHRSTGRFGVD
jgi:hypothetical protein